MKKRIVLIDVIDFDEAKAHLEKELPMFLYGSEFKAHEDKFCMFVDDDKETVAAAKNFLKREGFRFYIDESYSIRTMSQLADYINANREWFCNASLAIERNGWNDEMGKDFCVASDGKERVVFDDQDKAIVADAKKLKAIYSYNGKPVFIAFTDDVAGATPIEESGNMGVFPVSAYNGCNVYCTNDDVYGGDESLGEEIVCTECVNPENPQRLIGHFWTKEYAEQDEFERTFITRTDKFYDWTSERTRMIDKIYDKSEEGCISADDYRELKGDWDRSVSEFKETHQYCFRMDAPFDAVMSDADCGIRGLTHEVYNRTLQ